MQLPKSMPGFKLCKKNPFIDCPLEKCARLEIVCGLIPHLGFKSLTLRHIKYQLLIQRLVLFFYPIVAQKPLLQGLSRTFSQKGILR